jgi:hypothetical protein
MTKAVLRFAVKRGLVPRVLLDAYRRRYWCMFETGADEAGLLMRALHLSMTFDRLSGPQARTTAEPRPAVSLSA